MPDEQHKFQHIIDASLEFAQTKDVDLLLEKILSTAKKLVNAEAGSIYIHGNGTFYYHHTQTTASTSQSASNGLYNASPVPIAPGSIVDYVAKTGEIVNIADLSAPPAQVPYSFNRAFGEGTLYQAKSIFTVPLQTTKGTVIGIIQLINPCNEAGVITPIPEDDFPLVKLFATHAATAIERAQTTRDRIMNILQILTTLRDTEETAAHFNRVGAYAAEIYEAWAIKKGVPSDAIDGQKNILKVAAMLHDIGKLAIPNIIRSKPGKLSFEEYETIKQHTIKGAQLLSKYSQSNLETVAAEIALTHHERWDGKGYPGHVDPETGCAIPGYEDESGKPRGKQGEEIPIFGRAVAIADVYDALTSRRVYRESWKEPDALQEIKTGAGIFFDPDMVDAFFALLDTIHAIAQRYPDNP